MRKVFLIACASFITMSGSAMAADCTRGMLWPYVRAAGDCLTDAEIAAGQKGAYSGPTNTNVDVSAIKPAQVPAESGAPATVGSVIRSDGALIETSVFGAAAATKTIAECHKGILWPFQREPGDCLTAAEKRTGQTGLYGGVAAVPQASPAVTVAVPGASPGVAATPAKAVAECHKGLLWPFQREPGDCLTETEKRNGQTGYYGGVAAVTQASATVAGPGAPSAPAGETSPQAAPQSAPVPQSAACSKSWFWPFVKESGDCATTGEKAATDPK